MSFPRRAAAVAALLVALTAPLAAQAPDATSPPLLPWSKQIAIREDWVQQRHARLLPMMRRHGIAMWIVATEEFHDDPLVQHIAPPRPYVGNRDLFVFVDAGEAGLKRIAITGYTEDNLRQFFETGEPVPAEVRIGQLVDQYKPKTIGLAIGGTRGMTRSLTYDTYRMISGAIGTPGGRLDRERAGSHRRVRRHAAGRRDAALPHRRAVDRGTRAPRAVARGDPARHDHRGRGAALALRRLVGARRAHVVPARPAGAAPGCGRRDVARVPRRRARSHRDRARRRGAPRLRPELHGLRYRLAEDGLRAARGRNRRAGRPEGPR